VRAASPELIAYLANTDQHLFADLFTFTLQDGSVLTYTSNDVSLTVAGVVYRADQVSVSGLRYKQSIGLDVDEQTITLAYSDADTIDGVPWGQALRTGVFDGAYLHRSRAFYPAWGQPPVGVVALVSGKISTIDPVGEVEATVQVKSLTVLLDTLMPCNTYQTGCIHSLFDGGCGLLKANYTMAWQVAAGPTNATIPVPSDAAPLPTTLAGNTEGLGIFVQGTILFTSGVNEGLYRTIKSIDTEAASSLTLAYPLETPCAAGDSFQIWPGCDKTAVTCAARFGNLARFRGFPYTPSAETAL
jgi:uncharacterized phage protein (TIGR02218 family)